MKRYHTNQHKQEHKFTQNMQKHTSQSPAQTKNLAKKIAKNFQGREVLGLVGELGSGKTVFVKGLAQGLGIKQNITSPTFVLLKPYSLSLPEASRRGIKKFIHADCYRLDKPEELLAIGIEEYLNNPNCITVIEWAEKIKKILPKRTIWINFKFGKKPGRHMSQNKTGRENERTITIKI